MCAWVLWRRDVIYLVEEVRARCDIYSRGGG